MPKHNRLSAYQGRHAAQVSLADPLQNVGVRPLISMATNTAAATLTKCTNPRQSSQRTNRNEN